MVQVTGNGTTWTTFATYTATHPGRGLARRRVVPVARSAVVTANFGIRIVHDGVGEAKTHTFDDVKIQWTEPAGGDGGPPPNVLGTIPPPTLQPGESAIVTLQVTVDAAESFPIMQNEASTTSIEQPTPITDHATNRLAPHIADLGCDQDDRPAESQDR